MKNLVSKKFLMFMGFALVVFVLFYLGNKNQKPYKANSNKPNLNLVSWGHNSHGQRAAGIDGELPHDQTISQIDIPGTNALANGLLHSVVLTQDGSVWTWGNNDFGQLAQNKDIINSPKPLRVSGLPEITKIATNEHHVLALDKEGNVWAWGLNLSGQLGDGTNTNQYAPHKIQGLEKIKDIAAGYRFSLAITENGRLFGWGALCKKPHPETIDTQGLDDYYDPVDSEITATNEFNNCFTEENINILSLTPKQINGIENAKQVSAGFGQTLILKNDGTVWSWGCNKYGQTGRGAFGKFPESNVPKQIEGLSDIVSVSAGFRHSLALDKDGIVFSWGHNRYGELGNGNLKDSAKPIKVTISDIEMVSAGYDYSLAVAKDGSLWGWGQNMYHQSGNAKSPILKPIRAHSNLKIEAISAGGGHITALAIIN